MTRKLFAAIPLVALVLASPGAGAAPDPARAHVRAARPAVSGSLIKYRLGSAVYPPGYHPRCGPALNAYVISPPGIPATWSYGGGIPTTIGVGPCHAKRGDVMTASLHDIYGHIIFVSHPSPGNFTIKDAGNDSNATLTITDLTSGHSVTKNIFYAY